MSGTELDHMLAEARNLRAQPSDALMARVLAEGLALQPRATVAAPVAPPRPAVRAGFWSGLVAGLGGSGVMAGLGGVTMLGLFLGYSDPAGLADSLLTTTNSGLELVPVAEIFLNGAEQ